MRLFPLLFLLIPLCLGFVTPGFAQYKTSTAQDVVIAFFKTGKAQPNFETLARASQEYRYIPAARQDEFVKTEKQKLATAYNNYDPLTDLLSIKTRVYIELHQKQNEDKTISHSMTLSFGKDDSLFFPYTYGDYKIAIVPKDMDSSFEQPLSETQYALIKETVGKDGVGSAHLNVQLRPIKSYMDEPLVMGGIEQWPMVANVAGLVMLNAKGTHLWSYNAPWYVSEDTQELRDMYVDQTIEKQQKMKAENPIMPGH